MCVDYLRNDPVKRFYYEYCNEVEASSRCATYCSELSDTKYFLWTKARAYKN